MANLLQWLISLSILGEASCFTHSCLRLINSRNSWLLQPKLKLSSVQEKFNERVDEFESSMANKKITTNYDADQITVLEGLEPVRKRPGMYIGSTGTRGLHHLVWEVVDNSIDEAMAGHCSLIEVILSTAENGGDVVTVRDNGRGIPIGLHTKSGKSALETVLTVLHAGGKFGGDESGYKISGGLHGVGVSVVNALSVMLRASVKRDGYIHRLSFSRGKPTTKLTSSPIVSTTSSKNHPISITETNNEISTWSSESGSGTEISFQPDPEIFKLVDGSDTNKESISSSSSISSSFSKSSDDSRLSHVFEFDKLATRLDELAYLNRIKLTLTDQRDSSLKNSMKKDKAVELLPAASPAAPKTVKYPFKVFEHKGGIPEYLELLCKHKTPIYPEMPVFRAFGSQSVPPSAASGSGRRGASSAGKVSVDVAFQWSSDMYTENVISFANGIRTGDGGTHVEGFRAAVAKTVNQLAKKAGKFKEGVTHIPGEFIREGLTAIVTVQVPEAEFEGQTKSRLGSPGVRTVVDRIVSSGLDEIIQWNPKLLSLVVEKSLAAMAAATAAKAARELVRRKSLLTSTVLPGKLADCATRDPSEAEIYIVEGDSAAGSAKQGRDRRTQAILPLRGKILNVEKCSSEKIYQNNELQALISALGLGVKNAKFDVSALRYHRVVIMTDADVDGAHIRILLLTFLYRYQRELIDKGFVYIACPPLFKVTKGSKFEKYVYSQEELDTLLVELQSHGEGEGEDDVEDVVHERKAKLNAAQPYSSKVKGEDGMFIRSESNRSISNESSAIPPLLQASVKGKLTIQRFKGLGEMMPKQLWDTTMNPKTRTMRLVTSEDAVTADRMFAMLMGDEVGPRKDYIYEHAANMLMGDLDF